ncbi:hypothetical protein [Porphyromonas endodontalis]|uniref:hypothetical protein n=1 Tax=Porphyromonas endodontalis TaxID=28124 RepID=UPI0028EA821B|nr:hypothetical protein [Porphyromonas endodontalis]
MNSNLIDTLLNSLRAVTELRYLALDEGQVDQYLGESKHPPIITPAALFDVKSETSDECKEVDLSTLYFDVRLYHDIATFANIMAPRSHLDGNLIPIQIAVKIIHIMTRQGVTYLGADKGIRQQSLSELVLHFKVLC